MEYRQFGRTAMAEEVGAILARNGAVTVPPGWLED